MLSCVLYYVMDNFVCIDYLCCQYKRLSVICYYKMSIGRSYNELIIIHIPEVLMNIISCHIFTKKINPTVILLFHTRLVEYYLEKGFIIIQYNSKNLSSVPNKEKQITHAINIQKSYFVMACSRRK